MLNFHYCPISIKFFSVLFILALLLTPIFVFADCGKAGTTVVFTNGIWGDEISAKNNLKQLNREYSKRGFLDDVTFVNSYNQTHMLGFMDVINSITQAYGASGADYDLTNILLNLHKDLNTQKVLLVGHSQGTFYTNAAYEYLIGHGVDKDSISVYNVATPADRVAGNGKYLTSSTDEVINTIVTNLAIIGGVNRPLPANIEIKIPKEPEVDYGRGHSFGTVYLGLASNRIIGDIDGQIANLKTVNQDKSECFEAPKTNIVFHIKDRGYKVIDTGMAYFVNTPTSPFKTPEQAVAIGENIVDFLHNFWISVALAATKIITQNSLWSASTTQYVPAPQPSSNLQIQNTPPTATIISAPILTNPKSVQDQLDDIQEKLDIIKAQVQELFAAQNPIKQTEILDQVLNPDEQTNPKQDDTNKKTENNTAKHVGGGGSPVIYPKILISEVKISEKSGDKNIFIELYNPNNTAVDLTGWYIFRNDTSFVTSTILSGKGILAGGYFLATRQGSSWDSLADLYFDGTLNDNDKISLKNPNGDIVDEISWLQILAGISYGRKWDLTSNTEQYFELQTPTPKAQNVSAPEKSNDTKITSTTYAIDQTELTITNVPFATSKIDFENALIKNESHQIWDDSKISDPVATGDNLTVAAENGTMATYTITVKEPNVVKPNITGYTLNGLAQNVTFRPGTLEPVVIEINTNEPVKFNRIYICLASATACDGSHYVKYFTQTTSYVSTISKSWDGKSSGGAIVADGVYKIVADIVNQDGKQTINNLTPYTITVSATNWAQGTVDSFTSDGKFVFHTSDFMPKQSMSCYFATKKFRDIYPSKSNQFGSSSGGCSTAYPAYNLDMSANKTIGEYDVYVSYCGNNDCLAGDPVGDYYRVYFDGTTWSTLPVDSTKTRQSNDVDVSVSNFYVVSSLSATYKSGFFSSGTGTISNVRFATSKSDFEKAIVPPLEAVMDYSLVNDPVLNGDILKVTSQSGAVKATYTITVDPISWSQGVITSNTGAKFYLDTSFITTTPSLTCNSRLHRSLYPFQNNSLSQGSFTCNDKNIRPVYAVDFSSYTTVGDYTIWLSDPSTNLGKYYQMNFDGTTWLAMNPVVLSNDAKILSSVYTIDQTALTITNVPAVTSKADFENNISKSESHQTWDDSKILDPVATGDTITVTAEDGTTKIYTITVNPVVILPVITNYTFNESAQNIVVNPIKDSVQIGLTSNENVNWMYIRVVSSTDPTVYKTFGSGTGCVDGTTTCSKVWDGSISHGTALVDGDYQIKVHIKDDAEKEFEDFLSPYIITVNSEL